MKGASTVRSRHRRILIEELRIEEKMKEKVLCKHYILKPQRGHSIDRGKACDHVMIFLKEPGAAGRI